MQLKVQRSIHSEDRFLICNTILDAMGNTPLIRLNNMVDSDMAQILVKFEGLNIGVGSCSLYRYSSRSMIGLRTFP